MNKVYYDNKPEVLTKVGNGSFRYAWEIEQVAIEQPESEPMMQYTAYEVIVWSPITANRITQAVINAMWPSDYEQKLVNEYNSAMLGIYSEEDTARKVASYKAFLIERNKLKAQVNSDCAELGIR